MQNKVKILLQNLTGIKTDTLYIYITDGNNNFYALSSSKEWEAKSQTTVCSVAFDKLPVDASGNSYFYFSSGTTITGGEIWFSNVDNALSGGGSDGIQQPTTDADFVFDHVEFAITANANINIDTTSVDQLGIPITMLVNPEVSSGDSLLTLAESKGFPEVLGTIPGMGLHTVVDNFGSFTTTHKSLLPFADCIKDFKSGSTDYKRLAAPVHVIDDYSVGSLPSALSTIMDKAIHELFKSYQNEKTLTFQDPVSSNLYAGSVTTIIDENAHTYTVFQFTNQDDSHQYNIYYPFFSTNCSSAPDDNALIHKKQLPPTPSCWGATMPSTMPPSAMVLSCAGVFGDAAVQFPPAPNPGQPANVQQMILGNLENQLVSLLNRGLSPSVDNLIAFNMPAFNVNKVSPIDLKNIVSYTDPSPQGNMPVSGNAYGIYTAPSSLGTIGIDFGLRISGSVTLGDGAVQTFSISNGTSTVSSYTGTSNYLMSVSQYDSKSNKLQFFFFSAVDQVPTLTAIAFSYGLRLNNRFALIENIAPFPTGLKEQMLMLNQSSQPTSVYFSDPTNNLIIIESANNKKLEPQLKEWEICGNFYPMDGGSVDSMWNAYSGFLHMGTSSSGTTPFIDGLGYGYAYDDQGGYSSDVTVGFDADKSAKIGILLNSIEVSKG